MEQVGTQTGVHTYIHTYGQSGVAKEAKLKFAFCGRKPRVDESEVERLILNVISGLHGTALQFQD